MLTRLASLFCKPGCGRGGQNRVRIIGEKFQCGHVHICLLHQRTTNLGVAAGDDGDKAVIASHRAGLNLLPARLPTRTAFAGPVHLMAVHLSETPRLASRHRLAPLLPEDFVRLVEGQSLIVSKG